MINDDMIVKTEITTDKMVLAVRGYQIVGERLVNGEYRMNKHHNIIVDGEVVGTFVVIYKGGR